MKRSRESNKTQHLVISSARMNPPHLGHSKVVSMVHFLANKLNAPHKIILSRLSGNEKNPLTPIQKLKYAKEFFPHTKIEITSSKFPGIVQQVEQLNGKAAHLHVVAGEDRVKEFHHLLNKYNGKNYHYDHITVHSAGQRNDSNEIEGISATKMREFVKNGDFNSFKKWVPNKRLSLAKEMFNDLKKGLHIKEEDINKKFAKAALNELFAKGYPIVPSALDGYNQPDAPDPVKEKDVDWSKVKKVNLAKGKNFKSYRNAPIVGTKIGANMGVGIGPTAGSRYGTGASGIGDPSFQEGMDSPSAVPFLPAYGITGSTNKDPMQTIGNKVLSNTTGFKLKQNTKNLRQLRKTLPYG